MSAPRPVASLKPALLARKGGASPAMRSEHKPFGADNDFDILAASQDALGWNDMGEDAPVAAAPRPVKNHAAKNQADRRAAFTLRLDSPRHRKLRLASAMQERSAQLLVTEALDRFLDTIPQLDILAAQVGQLQSDKS